jgi:hypothetical protein
MDDKNLLAQYEKHLAAISADPDAVWVDVVDLVK